MIATLRAMREHVLAGETDLLWLILQLAPREEAAAIERLLESLVIPSTVDFNDACATIKTDDDAIEAVKLAKWAAQEPTFDAWNKAATKERVLAVLNLAILKS